MRTIVKVFIFTIGAWTFLLFAEHAEHRGKAYWGKKNTQVTFPMPPAPTKHCGCTKKYCVILDEEKKICTCTLKGKNV